MPDLVALVNLPGVRRGGLFWVASPSRADRLIERGLAAPRMVDLPLPEQVSDADRVGPLPDLPDSAYPPDATPLEPVTVSADEAEVERIIDGG